MKSIITFLLTASIALVVFFIFYPTKTPPASTTQSSDNIRQSFVPSKSVPPASTQSSRPELASALAVPETLPNETTDTVLTAKNRRSFIKLIRELNGAGIEILDELPQINSLRVGQPLSFIRQQLPDSDSLAAPNTILTIPNAEADFDNLPQQTGIRPFEKGFLESIGVVPGSNTGWGEGVTVAVIDTAIAAEHLTFSEGQITALSVGLDDVVETPDSHGTGVASIIAGNLEQVPGVAPGAEILSIPIITETGLSTTFHLSEAIVQAVDAGADLINISLGGQDNPILQQAVNYAIDQGTLIVAAAGNESASSLSFPAAYDGVVSVGSIDSLGQQVEFSNRGTSLDFVAPGVGLPAATGEDLVFPFTGTSSSTPVVTGSIAAVMTESGSQPLTAQEALQELISHANEAGVPGQDPQYGGGIIDVGRTLRSQGEPVSDLALASLIPTTNEQNSPILQVIVENRGTQDSQSTQLQIQINGDNLALPPVSSLVPNTTSIIEVNLPNSLEESLITAGIEPNEGDINLLNNLLGIQIQ